MAQFHQAIYDAARNSFLSHAILAMGDFMALLPGTTHYALGRMAAVLDEHAAVLLAVRRRDPARAGEATRAHIQAAGQHRLRMTLVPAGDPSSVP